MKGVVSYIASNGAVAPETCIFSAAEEVATVAMVSMM